MVGSLLTRRTTTRDRLTKNSHLPLNDDNNADKHDDNDNVEDYLPLCAASVSVASVALRGLAREAKPVLRLLQAADLLLKLPLFKHLTKGKLRPWIHKKLLAFDHLAVDVAALLRALFTVSFSSESSPAIFRAVLHSAVLIVAQLVHENGAAFHALVRPAALRVALGPQPDGALDAALLVRAGAAVPRLGQRHLAVECALRLRAVVVVAGPDHLHLAVGRALLLRAV